MIKSGSSIFDRVFQQEWHELSVFLRRATFSVSQQWHQNCKQEESPRKIDSTKTPIKVTHLDTKRKIHLKINVMHVPTHLERRRAKTKTRGTVNTSATMKITESLTCMPVMQARSQASKQAHKQITSWLAKQRAGQLVRHSATQASLQAATQASRQQARQATSCQTSPSSYTPSLFLPNGRMGVNVSYLPGAMPPTLVASPSCHTSLASGALYQ